MTCLQGSGRGLASGICWGTRRCLQQVNVGHRLPVFTFKGGWHQHHFGEAVAAVEPLQTHAGGGAGLLGHGVGPHAHNHAPFAHQQQLLTRPQHLEAHQHIAIAAELDRPQAHARPFLQAELTHRHPLAQATGAGHQHPGPLDARQLQTFFLRLVADLAVGLATGLTTVSYGRDPVGQLCGQHIHAHQLVTAPQVHGAHAPGRAAQGPQFFIAEPEMDRHALQRSDQDAVARDRQPHPAQRIALLERNGDESVRTNIGEGR